MTEPPWARPPGAVSSRLNVLLYDAASYGTMRGMELLIATIAAGLTHQHRWRHGNQFEQAGLA